VDSANRPGEVSILHERVDLFLAQLGDDALQLNMRGNRATLTIFLDRDEAGRVYESIGSWLDSGKMD
jgi:hypothetical protein